MRTWGVMPSSITSGIRYLITMEIGTPFIFFQASTWSKHKSCHDFPCNSSHYAWLASVLLEFQALIHSLNFSWATLTIIGMLCLRNSKLKAPEIIFLLIFPSGVFSYSQDYQTTKFCPIIPKTLSSLWKVSYFLTSSLIISGSTSNNCTVGP